MSNDNQDDNLLDEMISLPDAEVVPDVPVGGKSGGLSPTLKVAGLGGGLLAIFAGVMMFSSAQNAEQASSTRAPARLDSTPGGAVQASSPQYQETLEQLNELRATRAAELGVTSVPTPEVVMQPSAPMENISSITVEEEAAEEEVRVEDKKVQASQPRVIPRPPAPVVSPKPVFAQNGQPQMQASKSGGAAGAPAEKPENPYLNSIAGMMTTGVQSFASKPMTSVSMASGGDAASAGAASEQAVQAAQGVQPGEASAPDYSASNMLLRPGDVLYAETLTTVTSDMSSPVLAEIVHGPHKGARLVGSFEADPVSAKMVVEFESMTFADGSVYDISAVAVDGKSAETAVASDVERRYIKRYGPILAATFVNGYAQAKAQPEQTVVGTGDSAQVVTETSTSKMAIASGLAAASAAVATDIASTAARGPKIILQQGWPIGILITDRVLLDTPVKADQAAGQPAFVPQPGSASQLPEGMRAVPVAR